MRGERKMRFNNQNYLYNIYDVNNFKTSKKTQSKSEFINNQIPSHIQKKIVEFLSVVQTKKEI